MPSVKFDTEAEVTTDGNGTAIFHEVPLTSEDIINCSYSQWYSKFSKHVYGKVEILKPIPKEFIEYLDSDDFTLPKDTPFHKIEPNSDNEYSDWEDDDEDDGKAKGGDHDKITAQTKSTKPDPTLKFQSFHSQIKSVFEKFKKVAPKLNWSAPQDATWMTVNKTMQCHTPSELYLLLKSSDYINHDLHHAFDGIELDSKLQQSSTIEPELVLRQWKDINPSTEFRCFVRDRQLIAISQRDLNHYTFLEEMQDDILDSICLFFEDVLMTKFDSNSFVFDVYLPKPFNKVYLIDVNPFARKTDPLCGVKISH
ncbi:unnamed protein product [Ambrosiozyma monospora]|uniref:Unnamed protein product n=1 Tax=Ambrosiozyma monospora TaxID=43982 RepID=A0ACB5SVD5_AMBMO|nr:unnamed protein product [Ambrosiozyma monospora]